MLAERKRYNYNVNSTTTTTSSRSQKKLEQKLKSSKTYQDNVNFELCREELEMANKRLLEETTRNFKRLETDVQRVERILEEKEANITELQQGSKVLIQSLEQAKEENQLLIEALFSKDLIIKQFQAKINELLEQRSRQKEKKEEITLSNGETQTDPLPQTFPADEMYELMQKNNHLLTELKDCKQDLSQANNKVAFLNLQFQSYKLQLETNILKPF